jgi:hypothetical protein
VSHSINSEREALWPPPDLLLGFREGLGARGGGWEGSKGVTDIVGSQVSRTTPSHHTSSLPSPYPHRLPWQGVCDPTEHPLYPLAPCYNPKPSRCGQFRVLDAQPLSLTRICERAAPQPHHSFRATPPTPNTSHQRSLTRQTQNQARLARFRVFGTQPLSPSHICERLAPRPPSLFSSNPTNTHHLPPPPFDTADPKPSHAGSISGFWHPTPLPRSRL